MRILFPLSSLPPRLTTRTGGGIDPENFELLAKRSHTSKLKEFTDLESISSFGFRYFPFLDGVLSRLRAESG